MTARHDRQALVPVLRFPEFSGKWEEKRLGEVVSRISDLVNPASLNDKLPLLELEDIEAETGKIIGKSDPSQTKSLKNRFRIGDVIFGKLRPYLRKYVKPEFNGLCSSEFWVLRSNHLSDGYLYYLIQTYKFVKTANKSSGSKMPRADWKSVEKERFPIPHPDEQQKIADFLSAVDARIEGLRARAEALRTWKRGLLQQIFSQTLRFSRDDGTPFPPWEEKRLGDVADVNWGDTSITKSSYVKSGFPAFSAAGFDGFLSSYKHSKKGIALSAIGNCGEIYLSPQKWTAIKNTITVFVLESNDTNYIFYAIQSGIDWKKSGAAQPFISLQSARNATLYTPHLDEQEKIATFLSAVDARIEAVTDQITQTEAYKKALLQQMFV